MVSVLKRFRPHLIIFAVIAGGYLSGLFASMQWVQNDLAFRLLPRDASRQIVVVEIDARSLQRLNGWPWPRRHHAQLIDRLIAAGARDIALDIDFSSRSVEQDDGALANAMARASRKVILPVFRQTFRQEGEAPRTIHSAPFEPFAVHARLATVNIGLDEDGNVRRYRMRDSWREQTVESMAAALAADAPPARDAFLIDYGIRPDTIPRISYADVLDGTFRKDAVAGKTIIVGATSAELGDRLSVPVYRVLPGPVVQAMAYESLIQGRAIYRIDALPVLTIAFLFAVLLGPFLGRRSWRAGLGISTGVTVGSTLVSVGVLAVWPVFIDTTPWCLVTLLSCLWSHWRALDRNTLSLFHDRAELLQDRAMMKSVVDHSFDGIVIVDRHGDIVHFNPTAEKILNIKASHAVGVPIRQIIPWSQRMEKLFSPDEEDDEKTAGNVFGPSELALRRNENDDCMLELVVSSSRMAVADQSGTHPEPGKQIYIFTFRDITERKKAEEAQRAARERAEAASRARTEFLAHIGHELRTPLNAIIGFSEVMKSQAFGPLGSPRYREYIGDIHDSGSHLVAIIDDIMDMSKIEAGELKTNESIFDFNRVSDACMRLMADRARKGEVTVTSMLPNDLPGLHADERLIKQILLNLLSNAVKFTPPGGAVTLSAQIDASGLVFSVRDTGVGIPAEKMTVILKPFGQANTSLDREHEGTGLGLPLVKLLAELHGGRLDILSTEGQGTTASIWLPATRLVAERQIA